MTARRSNMATAAANRASGVRPQAAMTERTKPHRVTLDLDPALFRDLNRWIATAAVEADRPRLSLAEALRAIVQATISDTSATGHVLAALRKAD